MEATNLPIQEIIQPVITKKSFYKKRWFYIISAIFVILVVSVAYFSLKADNSAFVTAQVKRGNIEQTVEATGEISVLEKVDLAFQTSGIVSERFFDVGDTVNTGEVIMSVASGEAKADLAQTQAQVDKAQAQVDKLLEGASKSEIAIAQATLDGATVDLENTKITSQAIVDAALISLQTAQDSYNNQLDGNSEDSLQSYDDLHTIIRGNVIQIRSALSDADEILGIENTLANQNFEIYLSQNNPQDLIDAKKVFAFAGKYRDISEESVYALNENSIHEQILAVSNDVSLALNYTSLTLLYTRRVLDATIVDANALSQADIAAFKASIDATRSAIQTEEISLKSQLQLIHSTSISFVTSETALYNALLTAKQAYKKTESDYSTSVAESTVALQKAQANYDDTVASVRSVDLASAYADLYIASAQLSAAITRFDKIEITSPISGTITQVAYNVGELATGGQNAVTVQALNDSYKIELNVSESDIVKVSLGDRAEISFDAYTEDIIVEGTVGAIDPAETQIEGVVFYSVDIFFPYDQAVALKPGMSTDVIIYTEDRMNVLYIPQRAVLEKTDGRKYVRVQSGDTFTEVDIATGLRGDGGLVEIVSGLNEMDTVILSIQE